MRAATPPVRCTIPEPAKSEYTPLPPIFHRQGVEFGDEAYSPSPMDNDWVDKAIINAEKEDMRNFVLPAIAPEAIVTAVARLPEKVIARIGRR